MNAPVNIYARLGIKTVINGQGTYTTLGGSLMPPEVLRAMVEAAGSFVSITELQEKVGRTNCRTDGGSGGDGDGGGGVCDHGRDGRVHGPRRSYCDRRACRIRPA